jgi:Mn2+/Fe2+ NRAMP family transporter
MFTIQGAVTLVTASIAASLFGGNPSTWSLFLLLGGALVLLFGNYAALDRLIKWVVVLLTISTMIATFFAALRYQGPLLTVVPPRWDWPTFSFLIAFMGWMPSAIDISVWSSLWSLEQSKSQNQPLVLKDALLDFRVGYLGTAFIAFFFMALGALVLFPQQQVFASSGPGFAKQFIDMYTSLLGDWSFPLIATAALTTMASTTVTCLDAFPRVLTALSEFLPSWDKHPSNSLRYRLSLAMIALGSWLTIQWFGRHMVRLVDIATTLSFLTAPLLAWMNYRLVTAPWFPEEARPGPRLQALSLVGLVFLSLFALAFLIWRFFATP